ncbi:MAG: hypothetical protein QOG80_1663 [Pseudonocardiales bacterium]|jgi:hypothetical protein|nr:hypothetical protein [Pseudonocardiales bacterium]
MTIRRVHFRRNTTFIIGVLATLVAGLVTPVSAVASALPTPTLVSAAVTSTYVAPCNPSTCSIPDVVVKQGDAFVLTVTLTASGAPAAFTKDTVLTLTAPGPGTLTPSSVTMPKGVSGQSFAVSYSTYTNGVTVTASVGGAKGKPSSIASTPSNTFNVLQTLKTAPASVGVAFTDGTGLTNCTSTDAANPVCGVVLLPHGANSNVLLSSGACNGVGCDQRGTVSQVVADLTNLYSRTAPATLVIHCYRTICGNGGISKYTVLASTSATGALTPAPPCPSKGVVGPTQQFCTDYVESNRDGVDNLLLYLLFIDDFRGSI